ncbi:MAG: sulfurtransferase complex subunit TusD [Buchnera aphidicola (Kaburagia rhusicola rhusicola)]
MNYTLLIMGPPYGTQNASTAFLFACAVTSSKNKLLSIFFHCDGTSNANKYISLSSDEFNLVEKWEHLHHKHSVKLNVCISAASRRGVFKKSTKNQFFKNIDDVRSSFFFTGLSELARYIEKSDRVIQF